MKRVTNGEQIRRNPTRSWSRTADFTRTTTLNFLVFLALVAAIACVPAHAQDSGLRSVSGEVVDKSDNSLRDAVIYLKNTRNLTVKTYISNEVGQYRFSGLDPNTDYEIHAEHDDLTSNNRTISSFDNRKEMNVTLKVDRPKDKKGGK
jgi:hypothetical protein